MAVRSGDFDVTKLRTGATLAALLLLLATAPGAAPARAQSQPQSTAVQADAVGWEPGELERDRARVERMAAELTPWGQVDFSARFDPSVRLRNYRADGQGVEQSSRFSLAARVDFADRPSSHARALQTLERARNGVRLGGLRGTRDALLAHGYLLIAQERLRDADRELQEARHELAGQPGDALPAGVEAMESRPRPDADGKPYAAGIEVPLEMQLERDEARLTLREARLAHREALQELAEARAEAARYSLPATARYEPTRFELLPVTGSSDSGAEAGSDVSSDHRAPPGRPDTTERNARPHYRDSHEYRLLRLELAEAQAELDEAVRRTLDDLRLRGAYRARAGTIDLEGGLINGTPALDLGVNTSGGPERWELELSAQFVLDESVGELESLQDAVEWARRELESFPRDYAYELETALASVHLAEDALALAEEDVRIHEQRLNLAKAALPHGISEENAYARIGSHPDLARADDRLSAARLRMYRAWIAYIRSVSSALELSGGQWKLAARNGEAASQSLSRRPSRSSR